MPPRRRMLAWLLMVGWVAAGCGAGAGQEPSADPTTTTTSTTTSTAASTSTSGATTTTARFAGTLIEVRVRGGKVDTAERRVRVDRGQRVRIRVEADVADEVHVHGYDLKRPVAPGKPATIEFAADLPGIYEVELEGAKRKLFDLEVR